jgi:hypothetical protein
MVLVGPVGFTGGLRVRPSSKIMGYTALREDPARAQGQV